MCAYDIHAVQCDVSSCVRLKMPTCAVLSCSNRWKKGTVKTFHKFPRSNPVLLKEWLARIKRRCWMPTSFSTLCSDHFEEECFDRTGQTTRLRPNAVPTFFDFSGFLRKRPKNLERLYPRCFIETQKVEHADEEPSSTTDGNKISVRDEHQNGPTATSPKTLVLNDSLTANQLHDHTYCICKSPSEVNQSLDNLHHNIDSLKSSQRKSGRLYKKANTLQSVVETLKKNLLAQRGIEMLENTHDVPAEMTKPLSKARNNNVCFKEGPICWTVDERISMMSCIVYNDTEQKKKLQS